MPIAIDKHHRFARFTPEVRRRLGALGVTRHLAVDAPLYLEGQPSTCVHFLLDGILKLNLSMPNGREVLVDLLGPGDLAGESAVLAGLPHFTSAHARSAATVLSVEREPYVALLQSDAAYFTQHMHEAGQQALRLTRRLAESIAGRVPSRLAYLLLMLDERFGGGANAVAGLELRLSRRELADMTGMRLESAIRALRVMEDRQVLEFHATGVAIKRRRCLELIAFLGCDCDRGACPRGTVREIA